MMAKLIALDEELKVFDGDSVKKLRREIRKKLSDCEAGFCDIDDLYIGMVQNIVDHLKGGK